MNRKSFAIIGIISFLLSLYAFAAPRTIEGVVTDTMCGTKHMLPGKSDADCTKECLKAKGTTYGLTSGEQVFTLAGDTKQIAEYAGKRVKVTGEVKGKTLTVQSIASAQ